MKNILQLLTAIGVISLILIISFLACSDSDDNDDDSDDDDDSADDDDDDSDDVDDDSDDDDDDSDDDDDDLHPPEISDAQWDPDPVSWNADLDAWTSVLSFYFCDPDLNLLGGAIYAYLHGTSELIWDAPLSWPNWMDIYSDCDNPLELFWAEIFAETVESPGWDIDFCVDLEVSDGTGLFSNKITNICVYVP